MIEELIRNLFSDNVILATIIMSVIPLIELKGAIPFGISDKLWGANALSVWQAYLWSIVGGIIITILLAFIFKPIYNALKDKKFFKSIINFFTASINKKTEQIKENESQENYGVVDKKRTIKKALLALLFVAIPVPGTGVYTGTAFAVMMGLKRWVSILCVTLGNIIAGVIISTICIAFPAFTDILLIIFLVCIALYLIYRIIVHIVNKKHTIQN